MQELKVSWGILKLDGKKDSAKLACVSLIINSPWLLKPGKIQSKNEDCIAIFHNGTTFSAIFYIGLEYSEWYIKRIYPFERYLYFQGPNQNRMATKHAFKRLSWLTHCWTSKELMGFNYWLD